MIDVDPELVRAVQRGDEGAMETLIEVTYEDVHRHCLRLLRDHADAADATQEVFVRVTRSVFGFRGRSSFGTWLHRVTTNVCLTMLRKRGDAAARGQAPGAHPFATPDGHDEAAAQHDVAETVVGLDDVGRVGEALRTLSEEDRAVIVLRDVQGLSTKQAAAALGISEGAAKVRLHRAHARLREAVGR